MFASDYRAFARSVLKGKWKSTARLFFLAGLVLNGFGLEIVMQRFARIETIPVRMAGEELGLGFAVPMGFGWVLYALSMLITLVGLVTVIGGHAVCRGLIAGEEVDWHTMFPLRCAGKAVLMNLVRVLLITLGFMLLFVPGLILTFSYAMADYIMAENPDVGPIQALRESRERMRGKKFRLFCLVFSFIGWALLASLATSLVSALLNGIFGSGYIYSILNLLLAITVNAFMDVYMTMAQTAFFMDVQKVSAQESEEEPQTDAEAERSRAAEERNANEAAARELYLRYHCSRRLIDAAGLSEAYERLEPDIVAEARLRRDRGDALMNRFDRDPDALSEILALAGEYGMDALLDRALMRVDRHIRQETLDAESILNMCGSALQTVNSGAFDERASYVRRKKDQIADMLLRLEERLPDASAERLNMIRGLCR